MPIILLLQNQKDLVQVLGLVQGYTAQISLDTCAEVSCVDEAWLANIGNPEILPTQDLINGADNTPLVCPGTCKLRFSIGQRTFEEKCLVIRGLSQDVLLGLPALRKHKIDILNSTQQVAVTGDKGQRVQLPFCSNDTSQVKRGVASTISLLRKKTRCLDGPIHVVDDVYLPPYSEQLVPVVTSKYKQYAGVKFPALLIPHGANRTGTRMALGIACIRNGRAQVAVANPTSQGITMLRGQIIGQFSGRAANQFDVTHLKEAPTPKTIHLLSKDIIAALSLPEEEFKDFPPDLNISEAKDNLQPEELKKLMYVLKRYQHVFSSKQIAYSAVDAEVAEHTIDLEEATKPIAVAPYRTSPANRSVISEHVKTMLNAGVIRESRSPWASPVVLVPKKDGKIRFAIDYRKLNDVTVKEIFALPRIDDTLDALGGANYFSTMDLTAGYWQIPMRESDVEKTAFVTHEGLYEWLYMPFGLTNAPATFQRMMNRAFAGLTWQCCLVYLDDIIIFSKTFDQHLHDLISVLHRVDQHGLMLKPSKCHICCTEVEYLGHVISADGIRANPHKLEVIRDWPVPTNVKEVQSFLGLCGYYRKLIQNFAKRESPLRKLTIKDAIFFMGPLEMAAFNDLKKALGSDPVTVLPDFSGTRPFVVSTDACDTGVGAVLSQYDEQGAEHIIAFASKMFNAPQLKWHTQEQEGYAIVWALEQFRPYLQGTKFKVITDHQSLQWMHRSLKGKIARWAMFLNEFNFDLVYRKGANNGAADAASRLNKPTREEEFNDDVYTRQEDNDFQFLTKLELIEGGGTETKVVSIISVEPYLPTYRLNMISSDQSLRQALIAAQASDPVVAEAIQLLEDTEIDKARARLLASSNEQRPLIYRLPQNDTIRLVEGLLCICSEKYTRILVPPRALELKAKLLHLAHDHEMAGHMGGAKTNFRLVNKYYWPRIRSEIKQYVKACYDCQAHKAGCPPLGATLTPTLPNEPNELIGIDLIGPLPNPDNTEFSYLLVMTDYFTKWPEAVALPNKEGATVAEAIYQEWYLRHGMPVKIHTDQGLEFTNDILKRLNLRSNVDHQFTTPYHPAANGAVERFNRTLIESLSCYVEQSPALWYKHVDAVLFAYRTTTHAITGYTPFFLMFGREARVPLDVLASTGRDIYVDIKLYGIQLTKELRLAHKIVKAKLAESAKATQIRWSKTHRGSAGAHFQVGDLVMMWIPPINKLPGQPDHSTKFNKSWRGPYTVLQQRFGRDSDVYLLQDPATQRQWSMNVNKLARYYPATFLREEARLESGPESTARGLGAVNSDLGESQRPETGVPEERPGSQLNVESSLPEARDMGLMTPGPEHPESSTDGSSAGGAAKSLRNEDLIHSCSAETEPCTVASASPVEAVSQEQPAPSAKSNPTAVLEDNDTRTRTTQQERRRQEHASQLTEGDYEEFVVSHDLERILSHGYERRRVYYMVEWSNKAVLPTKIYREDFDTTGCLDDYWKGFPVAARPKEFRKLPFEPRIAADHGVPTHNTPPNTKGRSRKRRKNKASQLQAISKDKRGESVTDLSV